MIDWLDVVAVVALLGAAVIAGVFFAFSSFVMGALARLPAEQGIAAMQSINVVVINPHFLGVFFGTAVMSVIAMVLAGLRWSEPAAVLNLSGGALYLLGTLLVTMRGNVPLNNALAGVAPETPRAEAEWRRYVRDWTRWNHLRTAAALGAALSFSLALWR